MLVQLLVQAFVVLLSALINVLDVISIYKQKLKPSYSHSIYLLRLELEPEEHPDQLYPYLKIINKNCISNLKHTEISQKRKGSFPQLEQITMYKKIPIYKPKQVLLATFRKNQIIIFPLNYPVFRDETTHVFFSISHLFLTILPLLLNKESLIN